MNKNSIFDHITLIYNPKSTGNAERIAEVLFKRVTEVFGDKIISLSPTSYAGHASEIAQKLSQTYQKPLIVSVSGDGGYHEIINGVLSDSKRGTPVVAVEAAGNANDHYRYIRDGDTVFDAIVAESVKEMELIEVTQIGHKHNRTLYAHSYWGLGLTSTAVTELNKENLTPVKEKVIVAKELMNFEPIGIRVDGTTLQVSNVIAAKVGRMAKILKLHKTEKAPPRGTLRLLIDNDPTRSSMIRKLIKGVTRGLDKDSQLVESFACTVLQDTVMQLDGEVYPLKNHDKITVKVSENKLLTL